MRYKIFIQIFDNQYFVKKFNHNYLLQIKNGMIYNLTKS